MKLCRQHLIRNRHRARALVINAGNANACTGVQGEHDAARMAELAADGLGIAPPEVLVFSTGIIGHKLPMEKIEAGISGAVSLVKTNKNSGDFARAIMTTDLAPKTASACFILDGRPVHIAGACKGSGMIAPNLATLLSVVVTDAAVASTVLQRAVEEIADNTFNAVTVDGDTSTNDSLAVFASGLAGHTPITTAGGPAYQALFKGLYAVCDSLARQIAADGEGAKHTITVYVGGTKDDGAARKIARTICESPLVKTALAGHDPNWGRILAAAGRAGRAFRSQRGLVDGLRP